MKLDLVNKSVRTLFKSEVGVVDLHLDTADTCSFNDGQSHVTFLTPGWSPWVSHNPVFSSSFLTISNNIGCVVKLSSAFGAVENSIFVELEDTLVCLDSNWDDMALNCGLHFISIILRNICIEVDSFCFDTSCVFLSADTVLSCVCIGRLEHDIIRFKILECVVGVASIAAVAAGDAIDELLFSKLLEFSGLVVVGAFHGSLGREGPAGAAGALILNFIDSTSLAPVNSTKLWCALGLVFNFRVWLVGKDWLVFIFGHVGHVVVAESEIGTRSIVAFNKEVVAFELF